MTKVRVTRPWSLRWRHNGRDGVSNHQPHHCLLNRLFGRRLKKTSKLRVTGLCAGNSSGTGEFPAQMTSKAENVSVWWRHHVMQKNTTMYIFMSLYLCNWHVLTDNNFTTISISTHHYTIIMIQPNSIHNIYLARTRKHDMSIIIKLYLAILKRFNITSYSPKYPFNQ